jgi:hypothetical protein
MYIQTIVAQQLEFSPYSLQTLQENYTELVDKDTIWSGIANGFSILVPLGFTFQGVFNSYDTIDVGIVNISLVTEKNGYELGISPASVDGSNLNPKEGTSVIYYKLEQTPNGKIAKIEFKDFKTSFSPDELFSCQIWIYEQDRVIELHHGANNFSNNNPFPTDPASLEFSEGEWYTTEHGWVTTLKGDYTNPEAIDMAESGEYAYINHFSAEGTVYRFEATKTGITEAFRDNFTIQQDQNSILISSKNKILTFELFDLQGKRISTKQINNQSVTQEIGDLPKGVYIIRIQTVEGVFTEKIMK